MSFVTDYLDELQQALEELDTEAVDRAIAWIREAGANGKTIFTCGNGGSASVASHFVNDLVKGASQKSRIRFKAICLYAHSHILKSPRI